ncbi:hypothetical protein A5780_29865 [Nocardia sp. 852002-20019_SCH5090214]|jgi:hypothetical protein|uniref:hypothetical protein n=1 Tax=Nocardia TaxID=1817 RepID=UPI0007EB2407|nr:MULTISPECIES: hypothetical protein [Nocardia]OBF71696.1 hypothetical protein A9X06_29570 [Mycobacterium sp. 852002-51759_SCH5129042]MBF6277436.1 hypothetical protein [Nocardia nova]OBA43911.1 hypothetical protein A5789_10075 [Nocardia sp. 852002-51101_SCH5132738]OBA51146.1 hypothetical protein A5780_29865 [Nocardia sp. 852002-20019_SCH5090214]OBB48036.1 hypothetical protein A5748_22100 [Nocardia sp. 852002-51244_SCH5132740]
MASREITVSVALDDTDWDALCEAADQAGMSVPDYLDWAVRLVTLHARSRRDLRPDPAGPPPRRSRTDSGEDSGSTAWTDTFAERLHQRAEQFRND